MKKVRYMIRSNQLILIFLYCATTSLNALEFDLAGLNEYKDGIKQMAEIGKTIENFQHNKAVAVYIAENARLINHTDPKHLFDQNIYVLIATYLDKIQKNENYSKATIRLETSYTGDEAKATQFRRTAAQITMNLLKKMAFNLQKIRAITIKDT